MAQPRFGDRVRGLAQSFHTTWRSLSLAQRFSAAAFTVVGCGMLALGAWVGDQIAEGVIQNSAASTALYIDSFIEPLTQDLADGPAISAPSRERLDQLLAETPLGRRVVEIKIWDREGHVVYSNNRRVDGMRFPITPALRAAFGGRVSAEFEELDDAENALERALGVSLLEVYTPVRESGSETVIAVAELYEIGDHLQAELEGVRWRTWIVVGAVTLTMVALLFGIVKRGSETIQQQRRSLEERVQELSRLLEEISALRASVDQAHRRSAESTDLLMRRVGTDLHDGPAQILGLALMHLAELDPANEKAGEVDVGAVVETVEELLNSSIAEIRHLALGLAAPELERITLAEALRLVAKNHTWRTGAAVDCRIDPRLIDTAPLIKSCLYRFAQESLINGFKHGGGRGQAIRADCDGRRLTVEVSDSGPGLPQPAETPSRPTLGLSGMRHRVESLGGVFELTSRPGEGARLRASFEVPCGGSTDDGNSHGGD